MDKRPVFCVDNVPVFGDLILAPMDGLSDQPFRSLARKLGSAMSYTEFINAIDVIHGHPRLEQRLAYKESERPVVYQIYDESPERLLQAAILLRKRKPDILDVNMGCSNRSVCGRGAGAGLLREPEKAASIIRSLKQELDIPITAKIRLGWDDSSRNYLEVAQALAENGVRLIAVHGRTKQQAYSGQADWRAIAEVKQALSSYSIPVVANGDVRTVADINAIKALTQCDAVMIGRAAAANPWIFARLDRHQVSNEQVLSTMLEQLHAMVEFYGTSFGFVPFRKYAQKYLAGVVGYEAIRRDLLTSTDINQIESMLKELLGNG